MRSLLITLLLLTISACASHVQGYTRYQQHMAAVVVLTACSPGIGSGVIIAPDRILTAAHVINGCPVVIIVDGSGKIHIGTPDLFAAHDDIARIHVPSKELPYQGPVIVRKADGWLCLETRFPVQWRSCGMLHWAGTGRWNLDGFFVVVPGNSGSGIWDEYGHLVGIATCFDTRYGLGCGTSLWNRRHFLE